MTTDKIHKHRMQYKTRDCFGSSDVWNSWIWRTIPASSRNPQTILEIPIKNDWAHHLSDLNLSTSKHFWDNVYTDANKSTFKQFKLFAFKHCRVINRIRLYKQNYKTKQKNNRHKTLKNRQHRCWHLVNKVKMFTVRGSRLIAVIWWFWPPNLPFLWGDQGLCLTQCYLGPCECPCQIAAHSAKQL